MPAAKGQSASVQDCQREHSPTLATKRDGEHFDFALRRQNYDDLSRQRLSSRRCILTFRLVSHARNEMISDRKRSQTLAPEACGRQRLQVFSR